MHESHVRVAVPTATRAVKIDALPIIRFAGVGVQVKLRSALRQRFELGFELRFESLKCIDRHIGVPAQNPVARVRRDAKSPVLPQQGFDQLTAYVQIGRQVLIGEMLLDVGVNGFFQANSTNASYNRAGKSVRVGPSRK